MLIPRDDPDRPWGEQGPGLAFGLLRNLDWLVDRLRLAIALDPFASDRTQHEAEVTATLRALAIHFLLCEPHT